MNIYNYVYMYNLKLYSPSIRHFTNKIKNKTRFNFCKLNHAYWEYYFIDGSWRKKFIDLHGIDFMKEFDGLLDTIKKDPSISLGVSLTGPPQYETFLETDILESEFYNYFKNDKLFFGAIWKKYVLDFSIVKFINSIKEIKVIVVGMKHLNSINNIWGIKDFNFIEIPIKATDYRFELLEKINSLCNDNCIVLYQCGEVLSTWLIYNLKEKPTFQVDMGRALDIWVERSLSNEEIAKLWPDFVNQVWLKEMECEKLIKKYKDTL